MAHIEHGAPVRTRRVRTEDLLRPILARLAQHYGGWRAAYDGWTDDQLVPALDPVVMNSSWQILEQLNNCEIGEQDDLHDPDVALARTASAMVIQPFSSWSAVSPSAKVSWDPLAQSFLAFQAQWPDAEPYVRLIQPSLDEERVRMKAFLDSVYDGQIESQR